MTIISKKELNILERVDKKDYKRCLSRIETCILATDLGVFFRNKKDTLNITNGGYDSANTRRKQIIFSFNSN
jgi:hypothetical protein